jgi:hypothetical protein
VSAVDGLDPSPELVTGGLILLVVAFAARELLAGALRAAGKDLWEWLKRRARRHGDAPSGG